MSRCQEVDDGWERGSQVPSLSAFVGLLRVLRQPPTRSGKPGYHVLGGAVGVGIM